MAKFRQSEKKFYCSENKATFVITCETVPAIVASLCLLTAIGIVSSNPLAGNSFISRTII